MGSYLRGVHRTFGPSRLIVCVPHCLETHPNGSADRALVHCTDVYATYNKRIHDRWRGDYSPVRIPVLQWWDWVESKCATNCKLWIIAPCGSDLMTLTGGFKRIEEGRYKLCIPGDDATKANCDMRADKPIWHGRLCMSGRVDILQFVTPRGTICALSRTNYTDASLSDLAKSVGVSLIDSAPGQSSTIVGRFTSASACDALARYIRRAISEWVSADCGTWRETIAGLSVSYFRKRTGGAGLLRHDVPIAHTIEDQACHGARATTWFYGDVGDRSSCGAPDDMLPPKSDYPTLQSACHLWDVSSMYPTLLRDCLFPLRLGGVWGEVPAREIPLISQHFGLIATVSLDTAIGEYPLRTKEGTLYPVGKFCTTLAGPELVRAALEGAITKVHMLCRYEMGNPFSSFIEEILVRRRQYHASGDTAREIFYKSLANAFSGKFAQSTDVWVPRWEWIPDMPWGSYVRYDADTKAYHKCRSIAGTVCERVSRGRGGMLPTAVYCFLTAYGRDAMRRYRELLGPCTVVSQDTDGLWLTDAGHERLSKSARHAGEYSTNLVYRETASYARFYDPRHYCKDGVYTLAGVCDGFSIRDCDTLKERTIDNHSRTGSRCESPFLETRIRERRIYTVKPRCRITPSGWALPIEIGDVSPNPADVLTPHWLYR